MPSPKMKRRKREARERILLAKPKARQALEAIPLHKQASRWPRYTRLVLAGDTAGLEDLAEECRKIKQRHDAEKQAASAV